jgi:L-lysine exporter family protein LysE/ArgO
MYSSQISHFIFGLLLGWGAAIPIGPMNLEIIRRNLYYGTWYGVALGIGACSADITYIILLALGAVTILHHVIALKVIGITGSLILAWFGYSALKLQSNKLKNDIIPLNNSSNKPLWRHTLDGYILTLINPYTILFWSSISTQIALMSQGTHYTIVYASFGVLIATLSWIISLNTVLNFTKHRLSQKTMQLLNYLGGIVLLGFAALGLWHAM